MIARSTERNEFTFFVSVRVPSDEDPDGFSETFASHRSDPWSIRTSDTSSASSRSRNMLTYARATAAAFAGGTSIVLVTISISGIPARL